MAWFLFIDDSGHDRSASPYEVLAGVAIKDQALREPISRLHVAENRFFGHRCSEGHREFKGRSLLKRKVHRHRDLNAEVEPADIPTLARAALDDGAAADLQLLKAWVEGKIEETLSHFRLPQQHHRNMLERVKQEIKRRTHIVRVFPNDRSCLRLVRALATEFHENWLEANRHHNMVHLKEHRRECLRKAA